MKTVTAEKKRYLETPAGRIDMESLVYVTKKVRGQWAGHVEGLGPTVQTAYWNSRENALIHLRGLVEERYNAQHTLRHKLIKARYARIARRTPKF